MLHTRVARAIARKSGFRPGSGAVAPSGRPPFVAVHAIRWLQTFGNTPSTDSGPIQFSHPLRRRLNQSVSNGQIDTLMVALQSRFWCEGYTEVRVVGRVFSTQANGRLLCGFALAESATTLFTEVARMPDTYEVIPNGPVLGGAWPVSPLLTPLSSPWAISEWVPIHENFLNTEVRACVMVANMNTTSFFQVDVGSCQIQLR